jgi:hypothetical protein
MESPVVRFRIYYDDGTTYDGDPWMAPCDGVQIIVQKDDAAGDPYAVGRELLYDTDFYCWRVEQQQWFKCDLYGMFDYLRAPGPKKVLAGRTALRSAYKAAIVRAIQDPDFPLKSAKQAGEERL